MFNSSGSMYEEIERNRQKKQRKKKILIRRIIVIIVLVIILGYLGILLNDIRRFKNGENPLIVIGYQLKDSYDDGRVETYYSLGWIFRFYYRETINTQEIAPFWKPIAMDDVLNREAYDPNLPEVEKDYKVPVNTNKREKVDGVLFFYDDKGEKLGTYKCILSEKDCQRAISKYDEEFDKDVRDSNIEMDIIKDRYVFIEEYKSKGTSVEERVVYLYDIKAKHLLAQYQDVRYSTIVEKEKDNNKNKEIFGGIDGNRYIAKRDNYWGIDEVNQGKVSNYVNYEYRIASLDEETRLYLLNTKLNKWVVFDPNSKSFTSPIDKTIESIHYKNGKAYVVAYEKISYKTKNYYLYDEDGNNVLYKEDIENLVAYDDFLIYAKGDYIYIIDYDGNEAISSIKLYINLDEAYTSRKVKPYSVETLGDMLTIKVPKDQERTHFADVYYYDIKTLELVKFVENVKETSY